MSLQKGQIAQMIILRLNNQFHARSVLEYWHRGAGGHAVWGGWIHCVILSQIKWPEIDITAEKKRVSVGIDFKTNMSPRQF